MLTKAIFLIVGLLFARAASYGAPTSGSEILRSQELIQEDKSLRDKAIEDKVFIKKIAINGADLLSQDKIKEITLPFERKWLTKYDIQTLKDLIKQVYNKEGIPEEKIKLSSEVKKNVLVITIDMDMVKTP